MSQFKLTLGVLFLSQAYSFDPFFNKKCVNLQKNREVQILGNQFGDFKQIEHIYQGQDILVIPILSKIQIFELYNSTFNRSDPHPDYYKEGYFNYDYIVPLCFNNQTFMLKIDFNTSLIYVASDKLNSTSRYYQYNSFSHGNSELNFVEYVGLYNPRCVQAPRNDDQANEFRDCDFKIKMLQSNEHFSGLFALENFEFVNFDTAPEEFSTDDKFVLGIIQTQSKPIFESHFNGILGLANYGQDLSFSDSVLNKLYDRGVIKQKQFSMCIGTEPESGGYLILGGVNYNLFDDPIDWYSFTKLHQYQLKADYLIMNNKPIFSKLLIQFDSKLQNILIPREKMKLIINEFIASYCPDKENKVEELCSIEKHIFMTQSKINITQDSKVTFPTLSIKAQGKQLLINNYIQPCNRIFISSLPDEIYCSALSWHDLEDNDNLIVLGSVFLRQHYVVVDNQWSRIGFGKKKFNDCNIVSANDFSIINDNNLTRILLNVLMLLLSCLFLVKVSCGYIQFYDIKFICFKKKNDSYANQTNEAPSEAQPHQTNSEHNEISQDAIQRNHLTQTQRQQIKEQLRQNVPGQD